MEDLILSDDQIKTLPALANQVQAAEAKCVSGVGWGGPSPRVPEASPSNALLDGRGTGAAQGGCAISSLQWERRVCGWIWKMQNLY